MISYELAKQLKHAGFPQDGEGSFLPLIPLYEDGITSVEQPQSCYAPTLSELIEACGEDLMSLHRIVDPKGFPASTWCAESYFFYNDDAETGFSRYEEAVARLWLALNSSSAS